MLQGITLIAINRGKDALMSEVNPREEQQEDVGFFSGKWRQNTGVRSQNSIN